MRLEKIGFYTLSDKRAAGSSQSSPLMRCELIVTDRCNFRCPYCRGLREDLRGTMTLEEALAVADLWISEGLRNVRISGGEPTVWPHLLELVEHFRAGGVERIAISTNGSADTELYDSLVEAGVNDFSISLDACCATYGDAMAGISGKWETVIGNIRHLSSITYVTVGIVLTDENSADVVKVVKLADELGVADIRVIGAAQWGDLVDIDELDEGILARHPILRYRFENFTDGVTVRGIREHDNERCPLVLDDMAVAGKYHFPCIIHMREGGNPIGEVGPGMRQERAEWATSHDTHCDPICSGNCLDVCRDYNNRWRESHAQASNKNP